MIEAFLGWVGDRFDQLDLLEISAVCLASVVGGFVRGFAGFGGALVIILVTSIVLGPIIAVPLACLSGLAITVQLLPQAIRDSEREFVVPFALATFLFAPVGTWILISIDQNIMKLAIAVFVLLAVAALYRGWRFSGLDDSARGRVILWSGGAFAGLTQGAAGVGGPPAVALALSKGGHAQTQRANVIGVVTALALCSVVPIWWNGLFTAEVIFLSVLIVPLYSAATWMGSRSFLSSGQRHYRGAALLLLAAIGTVTLLAAVRDLWRN